MWKIIIILQIISKILMKRVENILKWLKKCAASSATKTTQRTESVTRLTINLQFKVYTTGIFDSPSKFTQMSPERLFKKVHF